VGRILTVVSSLRCQNRNVLEFMNEIRYQKKYDSDRHRPNHLVRSDKNLSLQKRKMTMAGKNRSGLP
jgi:hypothetical protein